MPNPETTLNEFLDQYVVMKGVKGERNLFSYGGKWQSYYIPEDAREDFIKLYGKAAKTGNDMHLIQKPIEVTPLPVDIDFKQAQRQRQYTDDHVNTIVNNYSSLISEYFDIPKKSIRAFIFEKPSPTFDRKKGHYRDGFHVVFDKVSIDARRKLFLTHMVKKSAEKEGLFGDLELLNEVDQIFDTSVTNNSGWCLPGSRKDSGMMYTLQRVVNGKGSELDLEKFPISKQVRLLDMHQYTTDDNLETKPDINEEDFEDDLDRVWKKYGGKKTIKKKPAKAVSDDSDDDDESDGGNFSDGFDWTQLPGNKSLGKNLTNDNPEPEQVEAPKKTPEIDIPDYYPDDVRTAIYLVRMLKSKRAVKYEDWHKVGWALCNIGARYLKDEWYRFSKLAEKHRKSGQPPIFDKAGCNELWYRAKQHDGNGYGLPSLRAWAKEDSPKKYKQYLRERLDALADNALAGKEWDVAQMLYELYGDEYVCASISDRNWYQFVDHRWVPVDKAYTLSIRISRDLPARFLRLGSTYLQQASFVSGMSYDSMRDRSAKATRVVDKLKTRGFKDAVLSECANLFYVDKFEESLDTNFNLIGFENGVYDLSTGEFRDGKPEDLLSLSTGIDYIEFSHDSEEVKVIEKFFREVQVDKEMRDYVLTFLASCLDGSTKMQKMIIWTGVGSNGKSTAVEFFQKAFGSYCGSIPHTLITRKSLPAGQATPELAHMRGKRFGVFQEPEAEDQINVGIMKQLSGTDKIFVRPLYGKGFDMRPQFKMLLTCNRMPTVRATDKGTWRRLRVTSWDSEFLDLDQTVDHEKQFYKDYELEDKLAKCKEAFMWYLINIYYPIYIKFGLKEPSSVTKHTKKWRKKNDRFAGFINEHFEVTKKKSDKEDFQTAYSNFRDWYQSSFSGKTPDKDDFADYLEKNEYKVTTQWIYGVRVLQSDNMLELDDD